MDSSYWPYIAIVILIMFSAFFSGSEIALSSVNKVRIRKKAESGGMADRQTQYVVENFNKTLPTILIGNNLVNVASSSVATVIAMDLVGEAGAGYATGIMTVLILIFGEISPKIFAKRANEAFSRFCAVPLRCMMTVLYPVIWLVEQLIDALAKLWGTAADTAVTEEDLSAMLDTIEDEGVMEEETTELLQSALDFSETTAQEILVPRVDMLAIDIEDSYDEIVKTALDAPFSRIPVYEGSIDNIIGVLHVNHLLRDLTLGEKVNIRSLLLPPLFIHKTMRLNTIMDELRAHKMHIAVVVDEYGGTMGMVTMEDVLEELVGDIWDERDVIENEFSDNADGTVDVDGDVSISELLERFDLDDKDVDSDYVTLGGWAIEMLGGYPQVGDSFRFKNLTVTVAEMDDLRITLLRVKAEPVSEDNEE